MAKRKSTGEVHGDQKTPKKSRQVSELTTPRRAVGSPCATPSKLRSILKPSDIADEAATPTSVRKVLFPEAATPTDRNDESLLLDARRLDSSARRKGRRVLDDSNGHVVGEEDILETDTDLASRVLNEDYDQDDDHSDMVDEIVVAQSTPTKTPRPRGRPKGARKRSPTPPVDLPPNEVFFYENRPGGAKTSVNALPPRTLLTHQDYFTQIKAYTDPHAQDLDYLTSLHSRAFDQWTFELQSGFSVALYGYGSKRTLVNSFAHHLHDTLEPTPKVVMVNGYNAALTFRDITSTLARTLLPALTKLPAQPAAAIDTILAQLTDHPPETSVHILVHSIDAAPLRKQQAHLARLAAHPSISLLATTDTPNFALLWPSPLQAQFRFLYHDATTFRPFEVEVSAVDEVNSLLSRSGRNVAGQDGVIFVLRSLPENARNLFRLLVAEQLTLLDNGANLQVNGGGGIQAENDDMGGADDEDEYEILGFDGETDEMDIDPDTPSKRGRKKGGAGKKKQQQPPREKTQANQIEGVEYRTLYHLAVEQFVCSSDMGYRTLLKEFYDHGILESRRDALGGERLVIPFERAELDLLMEELI